jgi:hypothetical protein
MMKRVIAASTLGLALFFAMGSTAAAGCSCKVQKVCKRGGYAYVKRYRKVPVTCYKKKKYQVATECVETSTCQKMTCYKTRIKMVKSTCYKVEAYMKRVRVDADDVITH